MSTAKKDTILNVFLFLLLIFPFGALQAQTEGVYKGKLALPTGSAAGATYYQNSLIISIDKSGLVSGTLNFRGGSADKEEEYIHFSGTFKGELNGNSFNAGGTPTFLALDNKQETLDHIGFRLSGQITGSENTQQIVGKMSITNSEQDGGTQSLSYTANLSAAEGLQLTFPLGKSPKVFDKGWKFGASCILNEGTENEVDLSENIKWSGSGTFTPDKGSLSSPTFNSEGENTIILSVEDAQGNKLKEEFKVVAVKASLYAHTGCLAICMADVHGCMACPHSAVGYITGSAADVTINGLAAACKGDNGSHAACCGANTFVLNTGDPDVLIHGKQAVLLGAQTEHCGGKGFVGKGIPALGQVLTANDSAYYIDAWGKTQRVNGDYYQKLGTKFIGTTYITKEKGSLTLSLFPKGILTAGPNTQLKIVSDESGVMKIKVDKGNLYFNGHSTGEGEVIIELKDCGLVLKGTRFSLHVDEQSLKLDLLEGNVDIKFNKSGETVAVHEGESVISDFNTITERRALDKIAVTKQWQQIAENTPGIKLIKTQEIEETASWKQYLSSKVLMIAGSCLFVLIVIMGLFHRKKKKSSFKKEKINPVATPPPFPTTGNVSQAEPLIHLQPNIPLPKFCQMCGNPLKPGSKFCGKCGKQYL
jgi:uncharacterized Zn-binding protein involved in type VI secretion